VVKGIVVEAKQMASNGLFLLSKSKDGHEIE
jgi:hypothetical protein